MPRYREWDIKCKVYVGNLDQRATKHQIEDIFSKYGPLRNVWVARNPPGNCSNNHSYSILLFEAIKAVMKFKL